ncbi:alpha-2,8-polysialyltransferase family protein [Qipengyuania flava]|nr:alpha-2,8-polysialyltransferase family protein [Qipengyuania flava]
MARHTFVAGTPLHVMISLSLIQQFKIYDTSCLKIIDYFSGAKGVFERLSALEWEYSNVEVSFFKSHRLAYVDSVKDDTKCLYIDSDASFQRHLDLIVLKSLRPSITINVFEDGVGSYRTDLYSGFKKKVFDLVGVPTFLGGSPFTKSIFVYEPGRYKQTFPNAKCDAIEITEPLLATIARLENGLHHTFSYEPEISPKSDKCIVYLSNHNIDLDVIEGLKSPDHDVFIKLHPRITEFSSVKGVSLLENHVPAEIIFRHLLTKYDEIEVRHHGSSVEQYLKKNNVRFVRI